jgi:S-adenosylmethionine/arginine decarboxylase-like enzyme
VLAESHLAIHTWPEIGKTTLDIYVCNYSKDNTDSASRALETIISYLNPDSSDRHIINRGK